MVNIHPRVMFLLVSRKDLFFDGLQCNSKLSADDTSLFATVHSINKATNGSSNNLTKITKLAFQWKMSFNQTLLRKLMKLFFPEKVHSVRSSFNL